MGAYSTAKKIARLVINRYVSAIWDKKKRAYLKWKESYRYSANIEDGDIVFDVGGHIGSFSENILSSKKTPDIHVFEPVRKYVRILEDKFESESVTVHGYGLSNEDKEVSFCVDDDSSSKDEVSPSTRVTFKDITSVIDKLNINKIDMMKLNIEGEEFPLLNKLIDSGYISKVNRLQVQFHRDSYINNPIVKRESIRRKLCETHKEVYSYYFIWEEWEKK